MLRRIKERRSSSHFDYDRREFVALGERDEAQQQLKNHVTLLLELELALLARASRASYYSTIISKMQLALHMYGVCVLVVTGDPHINFTTLSLVCGMCVPVSRVVYTRYLTGSCQLNCIFTLNT